MPWVSRLALIAAVAFAAGPAFLGCSSPSGAHVGPPVEAGEHNVAQVPSQPPQRVHNCRTPSDAGVRDAGADGTARDAAIDGAAVPISDADRVVASLRPRFRDCYHAGLRTDPRMSGCVVLRSFVNPNGAVLSTKSIVAEGLSADVVACLAFVVDAAQFAAPAGGGSTLDIPITFVQKQPVR